MFNPLVVDLHHLEPGEHGTSSQTYPRSLETLRNLKFLGLVLVWGWVAGPALGYLITRFIPLAEPFAVVVLIIAVSRRARRSFPPMVGKSPWERGFRGRLHSVGGARHGGVHAADGARVIKGVTLSAMALAKPLVFTSADTVADWRLDPDLCRTAGREDLPAGQGACAACPRP